MAGCETPKALKYEHRLLKMTQNYYPCVYITFNNFYSNVYSRFDYISHLKIKCGLFCNGRKMRCVHCPCVNVFLNHATVIINLWFSSTGYLCFVSLLSPFPKPGSAGGYFLGKGSYFLPTVAKYLPYGSHLSVGVSLYYCLPYNITCSFAVTVVVIWSYTKEMN